MSPEAASAARMVLAVQVLQALARNVRVDLCRRKVAVTQQQLHDTQIGAAIEKMRCKRVTQAVGRQFLADAAFLRVSLDDVPERLARHPIAAPRWKQVVGLAFQEDFHAWTIDKVSQPALRFVAQWDQSFAIALANDTQYALVEIDLRLLEIDQF